jgi:hypothetical protein
MPINDRSIAGYVALTGKSLIIDDAYKIDDSVSYNFNKSFDEKASYRTRSILTVPLKTSRDKVIGVIQIINAMGRPEKGKKAGRKTIRKERLTTFTKSDEMYVTFFANNASVAIERAVMTREIILRMIRMAELRDPKETGNHVNRVGSYAIEIFEQWGRNRKLPQGEIKRAKDTLRIAAMLHDVGKVAISDNILKKPAKLTDEEYAVMRTHTVHGACSSANPSRTGMRCPRRSPSTTTNGGTARAIPARSCPTWKSSPWPTASRAKRERASRSRPGSSPSPTCMTR